MSKTAPETTVQVIRTEGGEELVVLTRREYDALLAQLGDEEAEDRMTVLLARESRQRIATGEEPLVTRHVRQDGDRYREISAEENASGK